MSTSPASATPKKSLAEFDAVADALFDKLTLTCHLAFARPPAGGIAGLRDRLAAAGIVEPGRGGFAGVTFGWQCPHSE